MRVARMQMRLNRDMLLPGNLCSHVDQCLTIYPTFNGPDESSNKTFTMVLGFLLFHGV